jgi:hypothetical protein
MNKKIKALEKLGKLQDEKKHFDEKLEKKAFKIFETIDDVNKIVSDLEQVKNGEYTIEDDGMLAYRVEVPKELRDLPFINDYLTREYGYLTGKSHSDLWLTQCCGGFIAVNLNPERGCYFVYDSERSKPIIEKREDWMESRYVAAVIELYQESKGEFGDVIVVNSRYGYYEEHFSTFKHLECETQLSKKELQAIVDSYESKREEEEYD